MKSVMISINPKWCKLIASGDKTIEVRKTKPRLETPFKCYIYCTLTGSNEFFKDVLNGDVAAWNLGKWGERKGNVIGEFICDAVEGFHYGIQTPVDANSYFDCYEGYPADLYDTDDTCLTRKEIDDYGNKAFLYGWHISDLKMYDTPKELSEFRKPCKPGCNAICNIGCPAVLERPPQSWCYVEEL